MAGAIVTPFVHGVGPGLRSGFSAAGNNGTMSWMCADGHGFQVWTGESFGSCFFDLVVRMVPSLILMAIAAVILAKSLTVDGNDPACLIAVKLSMKHEEQRIRAVKLWSIAFITVLPATQAFFLKSEQLTPSWIIMCSVHALSWAVTLVTVSRPGQLRVSFLPASRQISYEPLALRLGWGLCTLSVFLEFRHFYVADVYSDNLLIVSGLKVVAYMVLLASAGIGWASHAKHPQIETTEEMEARILQIQGVKEAKLVGKQREASSFFDAAMQEMCRKRGIMVYVAPTSGDSAADQQTQESCKDALGIDCLDVFVQVVEELPTPPARNKAEQEENKTLMSVFGYSVFFFRYCIATFLSPFFADICQKDKLDISDQMQGLIFTVFPVGIAITSYMGTGFIMRLGTRRAVALGVFGSAVFTILFGFVPDMTQLRNTQSVADHLELHPCTPASPGQVFGYEGSYRDRGGGDGGYFIGSGGWCLNRKGAAAKASAVWPVACSAASDHASELWEVKRDTIAMASAGAQQDYCLGMARPKLTPLGVAELMSCTDPDAQFNIGFNKTRNGTVVHKASGKCLTYIPEGSIRPAGGPGLPVEYGQYLFMLFYFLNGLVGAFAETGTTILLTNKFPDRVGVVTAMIGTVCGLGCMAGPPIGGLVYDIPKDFDPNSDAVWVSQWCFRAPFLFFGGFCLLLSLLVYWKFGDVAAEKGSDAPPTAPISAVLTPSRLLSLIAIALSGTIVATLDPTLSHKLYEQPYG